MANTIRVYTRYSKRRNTRYSEMAKIVDKLPKIGDERGNLEYDGWRDTVTRVVKEDIDTEQGNDFVYEYDYYRVYINQEMYNSDGGVEEENSDYLVAIKREETQQ